jgi:hypothetical protein
MVINVLRLNRPKRYMGFQSVRRNGLAKVGGKAHMTLVDRRTNDLAALLETALRQ